MFSGFAGPMLRSIGFFAGRGPAAEPEAVICGSAFF